LWRRLDEVTPTAEAHSPYAATITAEQRDQWIAELATGLGAMQATGLLSETELLFLREIATARIEVMRDGGYHYEMFLHRMPELFEAETEKSIVRIEQKLDVLEALRAKCRIEAEPYRQALEQVEREATVFFIMDQLMLSSGSTRVALTLPSDLWGEALAKELDQRFAALAADPKTTDTQEEAIATLRARLNATQSTLVTLPALLREFERCE
jgi:hypothetical protein